MEGSEKGKEGVRRRAHANIPKRVVSVTKTFWEVG